MNTLEAWEAIKGVSYADAVAFLVKECDFVMKDEHRMSFRMKDMGVILMSYEDDRVLNKPL